MPRECGCHGENENCTYCYGSGYVGGFSSAADSLAPTPADDGISAQLLLAERWRSAAELRYALAEERNKAEERAETLRRELVDERTKAEEQASALRQALANERRSAEALRRALAEERTRAEEQASALRRALADERLSAETLRRALADERLSVGKSRTVWERERDERSKAENRATALATALGQKFPQGPESKERRLGHFNGMATT
jgi:chromosome segregation ATPase